MDWKDLLARISNMAPAVGAVFGAPGVAVGAAIKVLANAFGLPSEATTDQVANAIASDPQSALKLKLAVMDYNLSLAKEDTERLKLQLADIQSARSREVETVKATGKRDINLYVLAWVIIGGFIGLIGGLIAIQLLKGIVLQSDPLLTLLLGSLSTDAGLVVGYFFGSSKGSADKTELLAKAEPIK